MKIICEKGYHAGNVLRLVAEYLEKRYPDDMILDENMEITLSLKNGENGQPIVLGEEELQLSHHTADHSEDYYNHDVLTHLYTRCKYEHDLKVFQLANYARLTYIYMDAVGLHEINNHLGHEAGDHMLCSIADGIRKYFPDDCAYRIGGDEFAVFAAGLVPGPALERVLAQLSGGIYARNPRPADMPEDLQPSVSIGAVVCTRTSVTFDDLYQVADEALYVAKRGGKSQAALRRLD